MTLSDSDKVQVRAGTVARRRRQGRRTRAALATATVAALLGAPLALTSPADAYIATTSGTQAPDQSSATVTTPSGALITASDVVQLHPVSGVPNPPAVTAQTTDGDATFAPGTAYLQVRPATNGDAYPTFTSIPVPHNDGQYHDWARFTLSFDHPVVDPVITCVPLGAYTAEGDYFVSVATSTFAIPSAATASGESLTPTLTLSDFTPGYAVDTSNTIVPAAGSYGIEGSPTRTGAPSMDHTKYQGLIDAAMPGSGLRSVSRGTGEVHIGTGGKPITAVTMIIKVGMLGTADDAASIVSWAAVRVGARLGSQVSGSATPAGYGSVAHTVTDLRLGTASVAAFPAIALTEPTQGLATDNSDAGYDALDSTALSALASSFNALERGKQIELRVPVSGVSAPAGAAGWIDFDRNGAFDAGEGSGTVALGRGSATAVLRFDVPADVAPGPTWLRLRTGYTSSQLATPAGWADSGEVEDYPLTIAQGTPQVLVTKTNDVAPGDIPTIGDQVTYTITVTNQSATQVVPAPTITDTLPSNLAFVSASDQGRLEEGVVRWTLPDIPAGHSRSVTVTATLTDAPPTTTNTAAVTTPAGCETVGLAVPCTASDTFPAPRPQVELTKTGPTSAVVHGTIPYTITVTNVGNVALSNLRVVDQLPAGASFAAMVSGPSPTDPTSSELVWTLPGNLAPGNSSTLRFTVTLD